MSGEKINIEDAKRQLGLSEDYNFSSSYSPMALLAENAYLTIETENGNIQTQIKYLNLQVYLQSRNIFAREDCQ